MESGRHFWIVCLTHTFIEVYFLVQVALIPVFVQEFQLPLLEASLVATVPAFIKLLMNMAAGFLTDKVRTKYLLSACMLTEGISAFAISQTSSFWMLVLGVSVMRLASPLFHVSGLSIISWTVKREEVSRSMGFFNAFGSLGSTLGLISLALFQLTIGWRWIYIFWSLPILVWSLVVLKSREPAEEVNKFERQPILRRLPVIFSISFLIFIVFIGLREMAATGTSTFLTTYLVETRGVSVATASLIFGLGPFVGILGSLMGGYSAEKFGAIKALSLIIMCGTVSLITLTLAQQIALLTLFYLVYSLFVNGVWPPMNTIVANMKPKEESGQRFSIYFFTEGVMVSVAPMVAAVVIEFASIWFIFPFSVTFMIASLITLKILHTKTS